MTREGTDPAGVAYVETAMEVGEVSRHILKVIATRRAVAANADRLWPTVTYRAVRHGLRWRVVAFQNLPRAEGRRG